MILKMELELFQVEWNPVQRVKGQGVTVTVLH